MNDILQEWALRHAQLKLGYYFNNARVLFFSGLRNYKFRAVQGDAESERHCGAGA